MVPLLPIVHPFSAQQTVFVSLVIVLVVVSINTFFFMKQRLVDLHLFLLIAPASLIGSLIFVLIGVKVPDFFMRVLLLIVLLLTLINPFQKMRIPRNLVSGSLFGGGIGALAATVGIGMTILSPILYQSSWSRVEKISPTANAIMAFNALFTIIILFWKIPPWDLAEGFHAASLIIPAAILSSFFGRQLNLKPKIERSWLFHVIIGGLILKVGWELMKAAEFSHFPLLK